VDKARCDGMWDVGCALANQHLRMQPSAGCQSSRWLSARLVCQRAAMASKLLDCTVSSTSNTATCQTTHTLVPPVS
jgi:hypothetical protein